MTFDDLDDLDLTPEERRVARKLQAKARERELERSVARKLAEAGLHVNAGVLLVLPHDAPPHPGEGKLDDGALLLVVRLPAPDAPDTLRL